MESFEEKLEKLESLSENIKKSDISVDEAMKNFEEGIKLAKSIEKELDAMESKIQILMNSPEIEETEKASKDTKASKKADKSDLELGLFNTETQINGTRS